MTRSVADLLLFARLSNVDYTVNVDDCAAQVQALGLGFVAQITNGTGGLDQGDCQAVIATRGDETIVSFRGTQVMENFSLPELWDDVDLRPVRLENGLTVARGFFNPLLSLWPQIKPMLPLARKIVSAGHSKGGSHSHLLKYFVPCDVVSFGAPMCADRNFNDHYFPMTDELDRVVNESDFAPGWGEHWHQPHRDQRWLTAGKLVDTMSRTGLNIFIPPHDIANRYIPALSILASS